MKKTKSPSHQGSSQSISIKLSIAKEFYEYFKSALHIISFKYTEPFSSPNKATLKFFSAH